MALPKKLPEVIGFYMPVDRSTDYTGEVAHPITGEVTKPPSMTKQEFVAECDIGNIIKEFTQTGQWSHISSKAQQGAFLDLPAPMDFQESIHVVMAAEQAFSELPALARDRFGNDPAAFLAFMSDPANRDEADRMGLLAKPPKPPEVSVVSMPKTPDKAPGTDAPPLVPSEPPKA